MDKQLLHYKGSRSVIVWIGVLTALQSVAILYQAIYLSKAITQMFLGDGWSSVSVSFALFAAAHVCRHLLQWMKERIAGRFAERTALELQQQLIQKIFGLGPRRAVGKYGSGNLVTLSLEGVPKFKKYIELLIPRGLSMALTPIVILIYTFTLDITSGVTLLLVMPILIVFLVLIGLVTKKRTDAQMETYQLLSSHFVDSLRGLVTLKYLGRSKSHEKAIATVSRKYRIATNRSLRYAFLSAFSLDFFSSLSVAVVAVQLGLQLIEGNMALFPALTILILAPEYFLPVRELGNDFHATTDGKEAAEQIQGILQEETIDANDAPTLEDWSATSKLKLSGIQYSSEEGQKLLSDINMSVTGYTKVGVVGSSGAGKSTLIDLLSGFAVPQTGKITIDGNEVDHLFIPDWQRQLTYIPQHPTILSDSIEANIKLYSPMATDEEVENAVHKAGLSRLVASFPNGLKEKIGQGGRVLSGGEEQRVAVARAMLQERPILLLDEPTAHLDIETEHDLKELLLPLMENKLLFFATHRLHWMKQMDRIIVMMDGGIAEVGTHDELLKAGGVYTKLVQAHLKGMSG